MSSTTTTEKPLALVTGASGFVGTETVLSFVSAGFRVRGTVRRRSQADQFYEKFPNVLKSDVEFVVVEELDKEGAFDDAVKGVQVVAHTASPARFDPKDNEKDILIPAIEGTIGILKSAHKVSGIKAVVITSSIAAYIDSKEYEAGHVLDAKDWYNITYKEAVALEDGRTVYRASKALAERAAWDFVEKNKPSFTLTTVAPTWILGHSNDPSLKSLSSARSSYGLTIGQVFDVPKPFYNPFIASFINVRDVALAHVKAVTVPKAAGNRYLIIGGRYSNAKNAYLLNQFFPEHKDRIAQATAEEAEFEPSLATDDESAKRDLGIPSYISLEDTIKEWGAQILSLPVSE
ncbi:NAD-P-binding protein [Meredithblackwellia eburnea MCA 4105]